MKIRFIIALVGVALVMSSELVKAQGGEAQFDFGDAPDDGVNPRYPTLLIHDGARHLIDAANPVFLGVTVDVEPDGLASANADGDDLLSPPGLPADDEDGIAFISPLISGQLVEATLIVSGPGFLNAWLDFNGDGDFDDEGEQIAVNRAVSNDGPNVIAFGVPEGAVLGNTFLRLRVNSIGDLGPRGLAADGEVEDHLVNIQEEPPAGGRRRQISVAYPLEFSVCDGFVQEVFHLISCILPESMTDVTNLYFVSKERPPLPIFQNGDIPNQSDISYYWKQFRNFIFAALFSTFSYAPEDQLVHAESIPGGNANYIPSQVGRHQFDVIARFTDNEELQQTFFVDIGNKPQPIDIPDEQPEKLFAAAPEEEFEAPAPTIPRARQGRLLELQEIYSDLVNRKISVSSECRSMSAGDSTLQFLCWLGLLQKFNDPRTFMTRGELFELVIQLFYTSSDVGKAHRFLWDTEADIFTDIPFSHALAPFALIAKENGYTRGFPDGSLRPDQNVEVGEALSFLLKVAIADDERVKDRFESIHIEGGNLSWYGPYDVLMILLGGIDAPAHVYSDSIYDPEGIRWRAMAETMNWKMLSDFLQALLTMPLDNALRNSI